MTVLPRRVAGLIIVVLIATLPLPVRARQATGPSGDLLIRGGWLFDATGDDVRRNEGILVRAGKLWDLRATDAPEGARVIQLADDEYVLPGLFDLHAHYAVDLLGGGRVDEYAVYPILLLANGVTSTFPAGEVDPVGMEGARQRIDEGNQVGARIHGSGP
ncbi:MAG: amidohydrolase, partial [Gemmatimonadota bacterium]